MNNIVGDRFRVSTICKPSARIVDVLSNIEYDTNELTHRDFVVIIAGSNDVKPGTKTILTSEVCVKIENLKKNTNVIVLTLPTRYDRTGVFLNEAIYQCNHDLYESQVFTEEQIVAFNSLNRRCFTGHGQHLNKRGKILLCNKIIKCIERNIEIECKTNSNARGPESFLEAMY